MEGLVATAVGGTVSEITGGKFGNGAFSALFAFVANRLPSSEREKARQKAKQNGDSVQNQLSKWFDNFINEYGKGNINTLVYYNNPPPITEPVVGFKINALQCFANCSMEVSLRVSGESEKIDPVTKILYNSKNSIHYPENGGRAVDISVKKNPTLNDQEVSYCAMSCGFTHGLFEGTHWHLQIRPGNGAPPLPINRQL